MTPLVLLLLLVHGTEEEHEMSSGTGETWGGRANSAEAEYCTEYPLSLSLSRSSVSLSLSRARCRGIVVTAEVDCGPPPARLPPLSFSCARVSHTRQRAGGANLGSGGLADLRRVRRPADLAHPVGPQR